MSKPIGGARKSIKNQEGQGMLDIDENSSVEDDMFENVKTDEDMDHEMEEEEGGSAFEEEIDPDESDQQEQAVIPKSQTPFLSDKDTPESYGELIGFMEKFIEDQKAENDAFRKEVKDSLSSTATDFKQRTGPVIERIDNLFTDKLFTGAKTFTLFLGDLRLLPFFLFLQGGDLAIDVFDTLWHGTFLSFGYYRSLSSF